MAISWQYIAPFVTKLDFSINLGFFIGSALVPNPTITLVSPSLLVVQATG